MFRLVTIHCIYLIILFYGSNSNFITKLCWILVRKGNDRFINEEHFVFSDLIDQQIYI